tara:strand:+ start:145 stop:798 length:654 start_codon:yes stop_codon:yes gene_type:complete
MKNLNIVKSKAANDYYKRNLNNRNRWIPNISYLEFIKSLKPKSILDIGCEDGRVLNIYQKYLKTKINYGIDLSDIAIKESQNKYKELKLLKLSSLKIDKIKVKFDIIICSFFLYLLDREEVFKQFDLIHKKLNNNGYLIINDFDPLFNHTNKNIHNKNLKSFKMKYDNFLEQSGLFKIIYKHNHISNPTPKRKYKSKDVTFVVFKKIDFIESYPENI